MNKTEKLITEGFFELLGERRYSSVTVKNITEKCQISRNTFYYHFSCIEDIPERYYTHVFIQIIDDLPQSASLETFMIEIEKVLLEDKQRIRNITDSANRFEFHRAFRRISGRCVDEYIRVRRYDQEIDDNDREILNWYCSAVAESLILDWFDNHMNYDLIAKTTRLFELMDMQSRDGKAAVNSKEKECVTNEEVTQ